MRVATSRIAAIMSVQAVSVGFGLTKLRTFLMISLALCASFTFEERILVTFVWGVDMASINFTPVWLLMRMAVSG
ncbi:hypothetical protein AF71_00037180 [Rhizobium sp. 57MFTsu3.2]|nr:hypothetical protein [Rhizobium sp. 57MFTsu3.2]